MSIHGAFVVFFCGIPHHNYHYNITVLAKDPLLRLKSIKNIIGNKKKKLNC